MRDDIMEQAQAIRTATLSAMTRVTGDNDRLRIRALYPAWTPGAHKAGDIYTALGQVEECYADYDNAVYPDIVPGGAAWRTFNRPLHGTSPDTAMPFVQPTGAHDMYHAGEYMTQGETVYLCRQDTAYSPQQYPAAWEVVT